MQILAICNQKGGSGKTTSAVNLAAALGELRRKILIIDLDSQASATSWLGVKDAGRGLFDVFTSNTSIASIICNTGTPGVDVVPSSAWLVGVEKALAGEVGAETIIRRNLEKLPSGRWDYILLDCPPTLGILTINALTAARGVIVPVEAHVLAMAGLAQLLKTVQAVKDRLNTSLEIAGIIPCRVDGRTRHAEEIVEQLRTRFHNKVFKTVIRENVRLAECPSFGQPITQYDSRSHGAEDYRALAKEVLRMNKQVVIKAVA